VSHTPSIIPCLGSNCEEFMHAHDSAGEYVLQEGKTYQFTCSRSNSAKQTTKYDSKTSSKGEAKIKSINSLSCVYAQVVVSNIRTANRVTI